MYKELMREKQKQLDLLNKKEKEYQSFSEASERIIVDIEKRINEAKGELTKKIKKHFAGVEVDVFHNENQLYVQVNGEKVLTYTAKLFERENIKREISNKIVGEYNDFYGEVKELDVEAIYTTSGKGFIRENTSRVVRESIAKTMAMRPYISNLYK